MIQEQSSLGSRQLYKKPVYDQTQIGRVTSTADYEKYGRIEVIFLDYSQPFPVWVVNDIDREPVDGDQVLVGFIQGRPDAPYLAGFVRNGSYTSNFIKVSKDHIVLQLPADLDDVKASLLGDRKSERNYVDISPDYVTLSVGSIQVSITKDGKVLLGGIAASTAIARVGDTIEVDIPTHGLCAGVITSGSSVVKTL